VVGPEPWAQLNSTQLYSPDRELPPGQTV